MRKIAHVVQLSLLLLIVGIFPSALWSGPSDSKLPSRELNLQEYIIELRTATMALDGDRSSMIHDFRLSLPKEWLVRLDDQTMRVETDWLATALLAEEYAPTASTDAQRQARQRLGALRETAEALLAPADGAELGQAHAQVERILLDREFQGSHEPTWLDKMKARVRLWISSHLEKLFGRMGIPASVGNTIAWILVSLIALLLTVWVVRSVIAAAARSDLDLRGAIPTGQDWRYWANEARVAAERGDFRSAIHAAYWTAVAQLEENHLLPGDRSRTPRESLRVLQRANAAYGPLARLTSRFELTWYGYKAATSADWDDAVKQLETLECLRSSTHAIASS